MASALYTTRITSWASLTPGEQLNVRLTVPAGGGVVVLRDISIYCGDPSGVSPNSIVFLWETADNGIPTFYGYDSGITGSINPIYIRSEGLWASRHYSDTEVNPVVFSVVNTAQIAVSAWDVTVSGWWLAGDSQADFIAAIA